MKVKVVDGKVVDADGKPFKAGEDELEVEGVVQQTDLERIIGERVGREKKKIAEQDEKIRALEAQQNRTPELERMLEQARADKAAAETKAQTALQEAGAQVQEQLAKANKTATEAQEALETERQARLREQITNRILGACGDRFINPAEDIVPRALQSHKREIEMGADGKPTGKVLDLILFRRKNEKGESVEEYLPIDKYLDSVQGEKSYAHYLRPSGAGGPGNGKYPRDGIKENPFVKATQNITKQQEMYRDNPELAQAMRDAAIPINQAAEAAAKAARAGARR
jgi:hypothetical protein